MHGGLSCESVLLTTTVLPPYASKHFIHSLFPFTRDWTDLFLSSWHMACLCRFVYRKFSEQLGFSHRFVGPLGPIYFLSLPASLTLGPYPPRPTPAPPFIQSASDRLMGERRQGA